jgi:hypothetical protein
VQREDQPIILTGYSALNKLLGRDVYTSHMQVGGWVGIAGCCAMGVGNMTGVGWAGCSLCSRGQLKQ